MGGGHTQHCLPGDAMQDFIADRADIKIPVLDEKEAGGASLGDKTVCINHQRLIGTGVMRCLLGDHLSQQIGRLDIAARPANVGNTGQRDRLWRRIGREFLGLGEGKDIWRVAVIIEIVAITLAARNVQIEEALALLVFGNQTHQRRQHLVTRHWRRHIELGKRAVEPVHMIGKIGDLAVQNAKPFIDRIGKEKAPVKN